MNKVMILLYILVFSIALVVADGIDDQGNPNDPDVNERANACYTGGSMEGKCDSDWEWNCGWYVIRLSDAQNTALRAGFPQECASLLPSLIFVTPISTMTIAVNDAITVANGSNRTSNVSNNDIGVAPIQVISFGDSVANVGTVPADGVTVLAIATGGGTIDVTLSANGTINVTANGTTGTGTVAIFYEIQAGNATTDIGQISITFN